MVSEPNYHTLKFLSKHLSATKMRKIHIFMKNPVYSDLSILEISKIAMHEFWYDYIKPKYRKKHYGYR